MGKLRRGEKRKAGGGKPIPRGVLAGCLAPLSFGLLLQAGCSGLNPGTGDDPLVGGPPIPQAALIKTAATIPPPPNPVAVPPAPASANSVLSNAALASAAPRTLDDGQDLRIGAPAGGTGNENWARQGLASGTGQLAGSSGAILRLPEPVTEPAPRPQLTPVSNPGSSPGPAPARNAPAAGNATSFEQLQAQMVSRGVLWQRLEMVGDTGGWKYSCSVPNRQNPTLRRTYEARASDPVAAIRAVLEQLDKQP
jgi:hypothetical protein